MRLTEGEEETDEYEPISFEEFSAAVQRICDRAGADPDNITIWGNGVISYEGRVIGDLVDEGVVLPSVRQDQRPDG